MSTHHIIGDADERGSARLSEPVTLDDGRAHRHLASHLQSAKPCFQPPCSEEQLLTLLGMHIVLMCRQLPMEGC